jgi:hypothetical protein
VFEPRDVHRAAGQAPIRNPPFDPAFAPAHAITRSTSCAMP